MQSLCISSKRGQFVVFAFGCKFKLGSNYGDYGLFIATSLGKVGFNMVLL